MNKAVIGIDEAGRGPLAGPLAVCALSFSGDSNIFFEDNIKDSKKLTVKKREGVFEMIQNEARAKRLKYAVCFISPGAIDRDGMATSLKRSVSEVLKKIGAQKTDVILLDGSLDAPSDFENQKTIIKGDETELTIALASVVAKVMRDQKMIELSEEFPNYGFEKHKGYGTKSHCEAVSMYGLSVVHRKSFCRNIVVLNKKDNA